MRIRCILWAVIPVLLATNARGQEFTLPIQDQDAFLDNTSRHARGLFFGIPFRIPLSQSADTTKNLVFILDVGFSQKVLDFNNNLVFDTSGPLRIYPDNDPNNRYPDKLFKNGFSRLIASYISIHPKWVFLTVRDKFAFTTGPALDFRIGSKHKRKYYVDDKKHKVVLKGNDELKLSTINYGWEVAVIVYGVRVKYHYAFNQFFQDDWNVDMKFHSIGIDFSLSELNAVRKLR